MFFSKKFNGLFFKVTKYWETLAYFLLLPYSLILLFALQNVVSTERNPSGSYGMRELEGPGQNLHNASTSLFLSALEGVPLVTSGKEFQRIDWPY